MFDKDNYLNIIDFGISQDLKEKVQYRQDGGTLGYMAPEVISKKNYRYQSDLFAVGVIIYRLIMGVMPYKNRHDKVLLAKEMLDN